MSRSQVSGYSDEKLKKIKKTKSADKLKAVGKAQSNSSENQMSQERKTLKKTASSQQTNADDFENFKRQFEQRFACLLEEEKQKLKQKFEDRQLLLEQKLREEHSS